MALNKFIYPAEWELQSSVWLSFPDPSTEGIQELETVLINMMKRLLPYIKLTVMVLSDSHKIHVLSNFNDDEILKIEFLVFDHPYSIWVRDFGPIFLKNKNELAIAAFQCRNWGYDGHMLEEVEEVQNVPIRLSEQLNLKHIPSDIVSEGGNREFNGKGVMMATEIVELQRNPGKSKEEIEAEFKRVFNVEKVIWLKRGIANDAHAFEGKIQVVYNGEIRSVFGTMGTGGHIDEYCRFLSPNKILLAEVVDDDVNDLNAQRSKIALEENYEILKNEKDHDGISFEIIRIPIPPSIVLNIPSNTPTYRALKQIKFEDGSEIVDDSVDILLPSSYVNFVISNGVILIPKYYKEGRPKSIEKTDNEALAILKRIYPTYDVIQLDVDALNCEGGGMHCSTQQQPKLIKS